MEEFEDVRDLAFGDADVVVFGLDGVTQVLELVVDVEVD